MLKAAKKSRKQAIRLLQSAGLFLPARSRVGNGIGRRAHLIARASAACKYRRGVDPANDFIEIE